MLRRMFGRDGHARDERASAVSEYEFLQRCLEAVQEHDGFGPGEGPFTTIVLKRDERLLFVASTVVLIETRKERGKWKGASHGVSIPIPGMKSVRYRVGATKGTYVEGAEVPTPIDSGTLTLTNQRGMFAGSKQTREWQWSKIVGITHHDSPPWTAMSVSNRQKTSGVLFDEEQVRWMQFLIDLSVAHSAGTVGVLEDQLETRLNGLSTALGTTAVAPVASLPAGIPQHGVVSAAPSGPPPQWATDPTGRFEFRWWDGQRWTANVATRGQPAHDPP